jgi:LCP family protein required for cell wall assembly
MRNLIVRTLNLANVIILLKFGSAFCGAILIGLLTYNLSRYHVLSQTLIDHTGEPVISAADSNTPDVKNKADVNIPVAQAQSTDIAATAPFTQAYTQLTPWDGVGRVTVLIMGLDYRDWRSGEKYSRSDTMILLTLDPLTKTAGVLSIPRDLWVAIPGFQHGKINTAYYLGDAYKLPGGGPGLAVKTVELFLGVPINYYAVIDFDSFVKFIDDIGGVKIDVPAPIRIDLLGDGSNTIKDLKPGIQVLPGEWALAYARNRHTQNGDFDRARRQQQIILGIRNRILDFNMLPRLISNAPVLYQDLFSGIRTNLTLDDTLRLALLAQQVTADHIKQSLISEKDVLYGWSPDKLSILIPIPDKVVAVRDEIFTNGADLGPLTPGSPQQKMVAENASVAIYNGSSNAEVEDNIVNYLRSTGMNIVSTGNAPQTYSSTIIVDHTGSPYDLGFLVDKLKISPSRIQIKYDVNAPVDIEVFLGNDINLSVIP